MLPTPISPSSLPRSGSSRPIKLRTACNQCCAAKVKCSGERTGCERCRNGRLQCIYLESRVGRVPGIRAKKRRLPEEGNGADQRAQYIAQPAPELASRPVPSITSNESTYRDDESESMGRWTTGSSLGTGESHQTDFLEESPMRNGPADMGRQVSNSTSDIMTSMTDDFMLPAIDFNLDHLLQPFPPSPPLSQPAPDRDRQQNPRVQSQSARPSKNPSDSQFVIDCTQIISDLENYIVADLKSFKIVLGLIKRALEKLTQLSDIQKGSRNMRCIILLTAIMYQIVELLEVCQTMVSEETDRHCVSSFSIRPSGLLLPGLGLGDFGIDAEEQKAWRSQMVLKEVRQASEVLRSMKTLAGMGSKPTSQSGTPQGRSREQCFVDLELRLTELAGRIARRG
ncbi:uncharacterized protein EI97DRAFT_432887 [Westerdykella ornata]|uniref:Zn(2)-C6 fungal-type domain-containing protein n=1 Tax=Westerdykella ornata TaxID=318751 RepID=A0A6A6JKK3_WESOR|nr:uncharacterized protein EI97DRAFT_432887 [Westerdykella ornata]KAF2276643.1 hypothetical protein EI97DRAFT_432887 [Westerdykella ornata]